MRGWPLSFWHPESQLLLNPQWLGQVTEPLSSLYKWSGNKICLSLNVPCPPSRPDSSFHRTHEKLGFTLTWWAFSTFRRSLP